jgi:hypothetical protein
MDRLNKLYHLYDLARLLTQKIKQKIYATKQNNSFQGSNKILKNQPLGAPRTKPHLHSGKKPLIIGMITLVLVLALGSLIFFRVGPFAGKATADALLPGEASLSIPEDYEGGEFSVGLVASPAKDQRAFRAEIEYDYTQFNFLGGRFKNMEEGSRIYIWNRKVIVEGFNFIEPIRSGQQNSLATLTFEPKAHYDTETSFRVISLQAGLEILLENEDYNFQLRNEVPNICQVNEITVACGSADELVLCRVTGTAVYGGHQFGCYDESILNDVTCGSTLVESLGGNPPTDQDYIPQLIIKLEENYDSLEEIDSCLAHMGLSLESLDGIVGQTCDPECVNGEVCLEDQSESGLGCYAACSDDDNSNLHIIQSDGSDDSLIIASGATGYRKDTVLNEVETITDGCSNGLIVEAVCNLDGSLRIAPVNCPGELVCFNGACVEGEVIEEVVEDDSFVVACAPLGAQNNHIITKEDGTRINIGITCLEDAEENLMWHYTFSCDDELSCFTGSSCTNNRCVIPENGDCSTYNTCAEDLVCDATTKLCSVPVVNACNNDNDCEGDSFCLSGFCYIAGQTCSSTDMPGTIYTDDAAGEAEWFQDLIDSFSEEGTTTGGLDGNFVDGTDYCDDNILVEYLCKDNGVELSKERIECADYVPGTTCINGACIVEGEAAPECVPLTRNDCIMEAGVFQCGNIADGCGGTFNCDFEPGIACQNGLVCENNFCADPPVLPGDVPVAGAGEEDQEEDQSNQPEIADIFDEPVEGAQGDNGIPIALVQDCYDLNYFDQGEFIEELRIALLTGNLNNFMWQVNNNIC